MGGAGFLTYTTTGHQGVWRVFHYSFEGHIVHLQMQHSAPVESSQFTG